MTLSWKLGDPLPETFFEEKNVGFEGGNVRYWEHGDGDPLFWFHGGPGANITPALLELSRAYRVFVLEMPGWGGTTEYEGVADLHAIGDLWSRLIPELVPGPVRLIGTSMGSSVALWIAAVHQELVTSVVIEGPFAIRPEHLDQPLPASMQEERAAMQRRMLEQMPWMTKVPADPAAMMQRVSKYTGPNVDSELFEKMTTIKAPVLILWGQQDQMFPPELGPRFAEAIPNTRLVFVAGAGHDVQGVKPDAFLNLVADHFRSGDAIEVGRSGVVFGPA